MPLGLTPLGARRVWCRPQQAANATAAVRKGQARARRSRPSALCTTAQPRASRVAQPGESAAAGVSQPTPAAPVPEGASGAQPSSVPGSSEPQNPPAGRRERVAAYLSKNGLDPEALQREQPEAFGLLTMPLARALVEAHTACAVEWAEQDRGTNAWCALPGELMRRITDLHSQAGLSAGDIAELWRQEPYFFKFSQNGVRKMTATIAASLAWLAGPPLALRRGEVSRLWRSQLYLFALPADKLARNLAGLAQRVGLTVPQQKAFLLRAGRLLTATSYQELMSKVDAVISAAPGSQPYLATLLARGGSGSAPSGGGSSARGASGGSAPDASGGGLSSRGSASEAQAVLDDLDLALRKCAQLRRFGFSRADLSLVLRKAPMALRHDLRREMQPALEALERSLGGREWAVLSVCSRPALLGAPPAAVAAAPEALQALGLSMGEARRALRRAPLLLSLDLGSTEFRAKLAYFEEVLGVPARQLILESPGYLKPDLASIDRKVHMMEVMGDRPREEGLAWINLSPARFCQSFGYDLPEWERRRGKWEQSERAARYGLAQAAQRHGRRGPPAAQQQLGEGEADAQQG